MSDCTCGNVDGRAVRNETCPVHGVYPCKPDSGARECDRLRLENKQLKARLDEAALIHNRQNAELIDSQKLSEELLIQREKSKSTRKTIITAQNISKR